MAIFSDSNELGIIDVVAVNIECFGLIILGYLARKFHLIDGQTLGLNAFISYYALPALVFLSISTISLQDVNLLFMQNIFISKSLIFLAVSVITFILSYKSMPAAQAIRRSAIFAMFATQSNDFALGYPILQSLYGNSKTSFTNYLYILAPIQLLILNPISLFAIETSYMFDEQQQQHSNSNGLWKYLRTIRRIVRRIIINPIILSTMLGIIINVLTGGQLPKILIPFLTSLSQSFSPIALFLLGLNINNSDTKSHKSLKLFSHSLLITLILIAVKLFIMPLSNRTIVEHVPLIFSHNKAILNETYADFAFLYGTIPAAPTVYIFSNLYNIETLIISAGLVISTLLSAPIIFVSANMIRFSKQIHYEQLDADLLQTIFVTSILSLIASFILCYSFYLTFRLRSIIHRWSFKLLIGHIMIITGGLLLSSQFDHYNQNDYRIITILSVIEYFLFQIGFFIIKLSLAFLSLMLVCLYGKSLCFTLKISRLFTMILLVVLPVYILFISFTFNADESDNLIDFYYGINRMHSIISITISLMTIVIALISFILIHHYKNRVEYEQLHNDSFNDEPDRSNQAAVPNSNSQPLIDVEDLYQNITSVSRRNISVDGEHYKDCCSQNCHSQCTAGNRHRSMSNDSIVAEDCTDNLKRYKHRIEMAIEAIESSNSTRFNDDFHQIQPHLYLVMLSLLIVTIHSSIEMNHLIANAKEHNGIVVEMKFLDILLVFSHGLIMFILFGFDAEILLKKLRRIRRLLFGSNEIYLPPIDSLNGETKEFCERFCRDYRHDCMNDITFHLSNGDSSNNIENDSDRRSLYFCGRQLVDWLLAKQLASERSEAIDRCNQLLYGRILSKVCTSKGLDIDQYSLQYNNKPLDHSLSLRFANISLNSELNLVHDPNKANDERITISIQYSDKTRKMGEFESNQTLWQVITSLFDANDIPELNDCDNFIFSINHMNRQYDGRAVLENTRLKALGLHGRCVLRLNCRPASDQKPVQKYVENIQFKKIEKPVAPPPTTTDAPCLKEPTIVEPKPIETKPITDNKEAPKPSITSSSSIDSAKSVSNECKVESVPAKVPAITEQTSSDDGREPEIKFLDGGENDELLYSLDDQSIEFVADELPENFFEHTADDIKHLLKELRRIQRSNEEAVLETQELRQNREQQKRKRFTQTILRIIFPYDRLVMQALFSPDDSVEKVMNVIKKYTTCDQIHLFVAPPKTILSPESNLYDLQLVPCGMIYCSEVNSNQNQLIRAEFKNILNNFVDVSIYTKNKMKQFVQY